MTRDVYSCVSVRTYSDKKIRALGRDAQDVFRYLLVRRNAGLPGVHVVWQDEIGWAVQYVSDVDGALRELEDAGVLEYDRSTGLAFLPNAIKHNPACNEKHAKGMGRAATALPECDLRDRIVRAIWDGIRQCDAQRTAGGPPRADAFAEGLGSLAGLIGAKPIPVSIRYPDHELRSKSLTDGSQEDTPPQPPALPCEPGDGGVLTPDELLRATPLTWGRPTDEQQAAMRRIGPVSERLWGGIIGHVCMAGAGLNLAIGMLQQYAGA